jgi:hypothetical protein
MSDWIQLGIPGLILKGDSKITAEGTKIGKNKAAGIQLTN